VLHLATHGFFLAEGELLAARDTLKNPMRRAGLTLCGAQRSLNLWKGKVPPSASDGILTAEEVSALQLKGTWIVTLSACDTGLGEARAGEGVLGLRRGFIQAGAQNLLMTLWRIEDETTVDVMLDFYQRAFATGDPPRALAEIQRDWLVRLRTKSRVWWTPAPCARRSRRSMPRTCAPPMRRARAAARSARSRSWVGIADDVQSHISIPHDRHLSHQTSQNNTPRCLRWRLSGGRRKTPCAEQSVRAADVFVRADLEWGHDDDHGVAAFNNARDLIAYNLTN